MKNIKKGSNVLVVGNVGCEVIASSYLNGLIEEDPNLDLYLSDPYHVGLADFANIPNTREKVDSTDGTLELIEGFFIEAIRRLDLFEAEGYEDIDDYNAENPKNPLPEAVLVIDSLLSLDGSEQVIDFIEEFVELDSTKTGLSCLLKLGTASEETRLTSLKGLVKFVSLRKGSEVESKLIIGDDEAATLADDEFLIVDNDKRFIEKIPSA